LTENLVFLKKNSSLGDFSNCFVLINKESGWTSFDVVAKLRSIFKTKKIGHAGTLDPLATGLLICAVGKYTKLIPYVQNLPKEYRATFKLGATTITDDSEGDEENIQSTEHLTKQEIINTVSNFIGHISQVPPQYSAIHINGKRSYALARQGKFVTIPARNVIVNSITIHNISTDIVDLTINCEKGTYIRSIARDIGNQLNVGGYMKSLVRTSIGSYKATDSFSINELIEFTKQNNNNAVEI
jgi:tRNA pseudouridine55 synthase